MKVFVLTSLAEYAGNPAENYVEGVFSSLENAQKARDEVFDKQVELNWSDIPHENRSLKEFSHEKSLYDTVDGNYLMLEISEKEVE